VETQTHQESVASKMENRLLGGLLCVGALIMVLAMLLHPEGLSLSSINAAMLRWVHGGLILIIALSYFAVAVFVDRVRQGGRSMRLGLTFYTIGAGGFIAGALISGFVLTDLAERYAKPGQDALAFEHLRHLAYAGNQSLASLGTISYGAAGLAWAMPLIARGSFSKIVGLCSVIIGVVLVSVGLFGSGLNVVSMTLLTALIAIWKSIIGVWFFLEESP